MSKPDSITRRDFFRGRFSGRDRAGPSGLAAAMPAAATGRRATIPLLRPPGAVEESKFLAGCTRCDDCLGACPDDSIVHAPPRFREAAGTPMIDPARQPCWMCDDMPCVAACEPDVLTLANAWSTATMGTARIDEQTCLAYQGSFCSVCVERCPVADAIEVDAGKPRVVDASCTGCGVCQHVCPAPMNAVMILPSLNRPAPGGPA